MERYVLFISEPGSDDVVDIHPSKPAARSALAEYVRARSAINSVADHHDDEQAIASYFDGSEAIFAITRITPQSMQGNDQ